METAPRAENKHENAHIIETAKARIEELKNFLNELAPEDIEPIERELIALNKTVHDKIKVGFGAGSQIFEKGSTDHSKEGAAVDKP